MRRTSVPDSSECADQLIVLTNHLRCDAADMAFDVQAHFFQQARASKPMPTENSADLRLTGPHCLGNCTLRDIPLPADLSRSENARLIALFNHTFRIVLRISAY